MRLEPWLLRNRKWALQSISSRPSRFSGFLSDQKWLRSLYFEWADSKKPSESPRQMQTDYTFARSSPLHTFHTQSENWEVSHRAGIRCLARGSILKVVSWNLEWRFWAAERATAAVEHLCHTVGHDAQSTVIMLQEVCAESLHVILDHPWIQENFATTTAEAPQSIVFSIPDQSFVLTHEEWRAASYFTVMLIPKDLRTIKCFRVPFPTCMGRDALVVDIPVSSENGSSFQKESLRLCTTHLESLGTAAPRIPQLALVSSILKGKPSSRYKIIAGLVGGDMNSIDKSDNQIHKRDDTDLRDIWEDTPAPLVPKLKPFVKDWTYGRARGNTWGYQSNGARTRKRLDKFLYTGALETSSIANFEDTMGKLSRLGVGLKT